LTALLIVPAAALSILPAYNTPAYTVIAAAILVAMADAVLSRRALAGVALTAPPLTRMWKDREAALTITLRAPKSQRLTLALVLPEELPAIDEELNVTAASAALTWNCTPTKRGRYAITQCAAEAPSLLGLWAVRALLPLNAEVRVYPDLSSAQRSNLALLSRGNTGAKPQRQIGRGREFEKLRDYTSGDAFDEIDWKATARRGRPITRVFQVEKTQEVYVILDSSRLLARPVTAGEPDTILEHNISAALLLAVQTQKQGDHFGLVTFSDRVHGFVRARNGKAHYNACRDALYTLHARTVTPDFDEVCTLLRLRLRRRALLVFLTELDDPILAASFVKNVSLLRRQHLVLVGMMRPPKARPVFEGAPADTLADVYQGLAGHQQWHKLQELAKVLQRQGVHFLQFDARTLAGELANSYLNLKQRQLL
jgi:uncharacterized protein (DUF58 family)